MTSHALRIGRAGEYRVASELLLRGYNPAIKSVDDGVDLILDSGKTIQVKTTASRGCSGRRGNSYVATFTSSKWKRGKKTKDRQNLNADFVIIWVVPSNDFYIIPSAQIEDRQAITVTPSPGTIFYSCLNNWKTLGGAT